MVKLFLAAMVLLATAPDYICEFFKFENIKIVKSSWQSIQVENVSRYILGYNKGRNLSAADNSDNSR